jgi:thiamine biosynthesis lipoprotein
MPARNTIAVATLLAFAAPLTPGGGVVDGGEAGSRPQRSVTWEGRTMGTYVHVVIVTPDSAEFAPVAANALSVFAREDSLMSNWTTRSEVARLNREAWPNQTRVESEVATVIDSSLQAWRESGGAFDITVEPLVRLWGFIGGPRRVPAPDEIRRTLERVGAQRVHFNRRARTLRYDRAGVRIDLGGIAKGYAVQVAAESLAMHHVANALIDLTGNMVAIGHPAGADAWRIGIRDPRDRIPFFGRVLLTDAAISTSGQYEQFIAENGRTYGHILNPRTGYPADGLISVTVVSPSAFTCDTWDTPLFVLGPEGARRMAKRRPELSVVLVQPGAAGVDTVWVEESLRDRFSLVPEARSLFVVRYF